MKSNAFDLDYNSLVTIGFNVEMLAQRVELETFASIAFITRRNC